MYKITGIEVKDDTRWTRGSINSEARYELYQLERGGIKGPY